MADGSQKKAGDLVIGDLVKTYHEKTFKLGAYKVEFTDIISENVSAMRNEDGEWVGSLAQIGWQQLLGYWVFVSNDIDFCIRLMAQVLLPPNNPIKHPYLRGASKLRADRCSS